MTDAEGITAANKAIRDSREARYVKDGLCPEADAHWKESNWCSAGGLSSSGNMPWGKHNTESYWTSYNGSGRYPYVQMMELATGAMY